MFIVFLKNNNHIW